VIEAYPLCWPDGRTRRPRYQRERSRFDASFARARDDVVRQVHLLSGRYPDPQLIISTNIALRRDGLPLAGQRQPDDPGVAIYFNYRKRQVCFACDRWEKVEDNMHAICKTIDALRGINRWGTGDMVEAAFHGFEALPAPGNSSNWRDIFGQDVTKDTLEGRYRFVRSAAHPDRGGSTERFNSVQRAYEQARAELG
jgi:hypothetical protein